MADKSAEHEDYITPVPSQLSSSPYHYVDHQPQMQTLIPPVPEGQLRRCVEVYPDSSKSHQTIRLLETFGFASCTLST